MRLHRFALPALLAFAGLTGPAMAQDAQSRLTGLQLSGDKPIQIESDRLEVREGENVAVFSGNVSVAQDKTVLKSSKMTVYYLKDGGSAATGSANIDRLEVDGNVYVKSDTQVATGDKATFDMKSEVLVLSGKEVVLSEGDNVIVGCKLTVQMKNGQAKLDSCKGSKSAGRVKMLLTPGSQNR
ncbi:LptA/OstA family protein [Nitratireductor indicus]|uniref:OstA-like protein n=1 Tax=Nitratireductor indicus C115 TaxID=1231190 RepID=K2N9W7_9HYPH|nr:LptA/OstA family protein [Nitratireductor indicus]EKF44408.1 OstA-like protein [Nitratireductor indicus C115]MDS1137361.1 LptA/OstA family protein [Nitratireductor indicus]SFQ28914.1 lipopolysaccharide export system protein LptA [Nitratireductor indicus]